MNIISLLHLLHAYTKKNNYQPTSILLVYFLFDNMKIKPIALKKGSHFNLIRFTLDDLDLDGILLRLYELPFLRGRIFSMIAANGFFNDGIFILLCGFSGSV